LNRKNKPKVLIIGASGLIGSNLYRYLYKKKFQVIGTFYKNEKMKKNFFKFNILKDKFEKVFNLNLISHVVIASGGEKKLDNIEKNYKFEKEIGYERIKRIIDECSLKKIKLIYISSDAVFDGRKGNYSENSKRKPINKYGKIKYLTEEYIKKKINNYIIIRVSKVLSIKKKEKNILNDLIDSFMKENYKYASDEYFTPIFVNDLCNSIYNLIYKNLNGIFHLKSLGKISRYELAKKLVSYLKLKTKINKTLIKKLNLEAKRGLKLNLNTEKYDKIFKIKEKNLDFILTTNK
jgi:dTDP-4-dehydrorhamnose reductase|tara:strand:+ start:1210 stop:2085 length:876 start_codon:yes stop_codon:yes gene_type:complete